MEWISENWLWLALGGAMLAMHLFGHRRHGSGGGGCCGGGGSRSADDAGDDTQGRTPAEPTGRD